jgi:2-keto-4-pentenoate hydratase/2-oxohepta-3-ene-1,7-dioic acid hydratase in catechol pathway
MALWIRFDHAGKTCLGTLDGEIVRVHDGNLFEDPRPTGEVLRRADVRLRRPVEPGKVIAMYNNFGALLEKMKVARPADPQYLLKPPNTYNDPDARIPDPKSDSRVIFEGELAIVIGRPARKVGMSEASSHVFGYTCVNDVTAVDYLTRDPSFAHWVRAKGQDGFCPIGPAVATGLDPATLVVRSILNGQVRQDYPISDMLFSVPELVSRLSHDMTLNAGDLILCGTSVGVGTMKSGSRIEITIDGIGTLANEFA